MNKEQNVKEVYLVCTPDQVAQLKADPKWTSFEAENHVTVFTSPPGEDVYYPVEWKPAAPRPLNRAERRAARFPKGGR